MKYELAYLSKSGGASRIVKALMDVMPAGQYRVVDMSVQEPSEDAEIYVLGFDVQRGNCPFGLLDFIEKLEGKTILLVAADGMGDGSERRDRLEGQISPFLPENCSYLGMHLSRGRFSEQDMAYIKEQAEQTASRVDMEKVRQVFEQSQHRPDMMDVQNALLFIKRKLQL